MEVLTRNLSTEEVKGLAFFLALPHSDVQNAFDTMDSISRLIAREWMVWFMIRTSRK